MKILLQLAVIFSICLAGDFISSLLPFTFPGSIIAMLILLILLLCKAIKPCQLEESGSFLQKNMAFFFLPANVSIMEKFNIVSSVLWQIIFISIISLLVTFIVASYSAELAILIQNKIKSRKTKKIDN